MSVSEWYPYGVLRHPLPCVRNVDGFPVTITMPVLILRMNGYRICPLFPLCSKEQMKVPLADRGPSPTRTLESLKGDHAQYLLDGGNIKRAKLQYLNPFTLFQSIRYTVHVTSKLTLLSFYLDRYTCKLFMSLSVCSTDSSSWDCHDLDIKRAVMKSPNSPVILHICSSSTAC